MKSREALARNLQKLRVEKGLSQEGLAFSAGIDRTYVSGIERGCRNPTLDIVDSLASALDVSTVELLDKGADQLIGLKLKSGRKPKNRF
jgi:transcriptional regulator with XRE-family HTH domain